MENELRCSLVMWNKPNTCQRGKRKRMCVCVVVEVVCVSGVLQGVLCWRLMVTAHTRVCACNVLPEFHHWVAYCQPHITSLSETCSTPVLPHWLLFLFSPQVFLRMRLPRILAVFCWVLLWISLELSGLDLLQWSSVSAQVTHATHPSPIPIWIITALASGPWPAHGYSLIWRRWQDWSY